MVTTAYLCYAAVQLVMFTFLVRLVARDRHWLLVACAINVFGLVYDNLILGLGYLLGPGPTLMALNYPRYLIHALTTPLFGLLGLYLARNAGARWARGRAATVIFWLLTVPALARAIYLDLIILRLEPVATMGPLRYSNASLSAPPLSEITVIVLLIVCGAGLLARARWPWLLLGSLLMFIAAGLAPKIGVVANLGEVALVAGIVATAWRFPRPAPAPPGHDVPAAAVS